MVKQMRDMDRYKALMQAEKVHSTLLSISRGDSVATDENALFITECTIEELVKAAEDTKHYLLALIRTEDELHE